MRERTLLRNRKIDDRTDAVMNAYCEVIKVLASIFFSCENDNNFFCKNDNFLVVKNEQDAFSSRKFGAILRERTLLRNRKIDDRTDAVMNAYCKVILAA